MSDAISPTTLDKGQTKTQSAIETISATIAGYTSSLVIQHYVYPIFDVHITIKQNLMLALIFTSIGIVRGYWIRRFFNWLFSR